MFQQTSYFLLLIFIASCKAPGSSGNENEKFDPDKTYQLRLKPVAGSSYHYDMINETDIDLEVGDKDVNNQYKTEVGVTYNINQDSAGNYVFSSVYDKIHITTKNNDTKTELDATNGSVSPNPVERMLALLKDAAINVTLTPTGEVTDMAGYKEIGEKLISGFSEYDVAGRKAAMEQWENYIGNGLIKKNFDQLFKLFPDSAVHLGDTWRLKSRQEGDLSYIVTGQYKLKAINTDIAIIESTGKISTSGNNASGLESDGPPAANLTGEQSAEFEIETKTGMVLSCKVKASFEGIVITLGKEVPVKAKISVKVIGKRQNFFPPATPPPHL